jgi:hypothetical protein
LEAVVVDPLARAEELVTQSALAAIILAVAFAVLALGMVILR